MHSLNDITGYQVRRTIRDGRILEAPELLAEVAGAGRYATALGVAHAHRGDGSYAIVDNVYACGCTSADLDACAAQDERDRLAALEADGYLTVVVDFEARDDHDAAALARFVELTAAGEVSLATNRPFGSIPDLAALEVADIAAGYRAAAAARAGDVAAARDAANASASARFALLDALRAHRHAFEVVAELTFEAAR